MYYESFGGMIMKRMICAAALILSLCRLALPVSAGQQEVGG